MDVFINTFWATLEAFDDKKLMKFCSKVSIKALCFRVWEKADVIFVSAMMSFYFCLQTRRWNMQHIMVRYLHVVLNIYFYFFQVKIWFQNRRSKYKKIMKQGGPIPISAPGQTPNMDGTPGGMSPPPSHTPTPTNQSTTPTGGPQQMPQPVTSPNPQTGPSPTPPMMTAPPPSMSPQSSWADISCSTSAPISVPSHNPHNPLSHNPIPHNALPHNPHNSYIQYPWYGQNTLGGPQQHSLLT